MALKVQYNKTFSQELSRQLTIRERALPILKSKETALRLEVKKASEQVETLTKKYHVLFQEFIKNGVLNREFPMVVQVKEINEQVKNVAGVKIIVLDKVNFHKIPLNYLQEPAWIPNGIEIFELLIEKRIELNYAEAQLKTLSYQRKKTTQKVNLYEKVQIPEYRSAILRIKRYLEDEENLQKAAQKIVKERHQEMEGVL